MNRLALSVLLTLDHFTGQVRRYWKRILIGAVLGWAASTIVGVAVLLLADAEGWLTLEESNLLAAAIVWAGVGLGALVAYGMRGDE